MRWLVTLALASCFGCYYDPPLALERDRLVAAPEHTDEAIASLADRFGVDVPAVYWYAPNCTDDESFWYEVTGSCVAGVQGSDGIIVCAHGVPPSGTALAHEIAHLKWNDPGHLDASVWGPDPDKSADDDVMLTPGIEMGDANIALRAVGL